MDHPDRTAWTAKDARSTQGQDGTHGGAAQCGGRTHPGSFSDSRARALHAESGGRGLRPVRAAVIVLPIIPSTVRALAGPAGRVRAPW